MHIHIMYIHASEESMTSSNLTYGLASHDRIAAMTGKQILQAIIEGEFPQAPISRALTFWIVEVSDGFAAFEGEPGQHLLNPMGAVHGGWALTLIDSVRHVPGTRCCPQELASQRSKLRAISRGLLRRQRAGCVLRAVSSPMAVKLFRQRRRSAIPVAAFWLMASRRSWF